MGKVIAILAAAVAVAGGVSYAILGDVHHSCDRADVASCEVMQMRCCGEADACVSAIDEPPAGMAVAGPAAMFVPAPAKAGERGLLSVAGTAATMAK